MDTEPAAVSRRILFVRQHMGPVGEGTSARGWEQASRLAAEGHTVTLLTGRAIPAGDAPTGVEVRSLATKYRQEMGYFRRKLSFLAFAMRAVAVAMRGRFDVIFASSTPLTVFIPAMVAKAIRPSSRLVLEVRDLWPALPIALGALERPSERWLARRLESFSYRMADQLIALSPGMASAIERTSGKDVVVVPNGSSRHQMTVDTSEVVRLRTELKLPDAAGVVLYAGSIGEVNDPDYLLALIQASGRANPGVYFVIVGSGPGHDALRAQLGDHPTARIVGRVTRAEVVRYFALADVSLVTFVSEPVMETNSANKFFDSLAAGCPIAVNYGGWHAEMLEERGAGVRLSRDAGVAAAELAGLMADAQALDRMARNALALSEGFEWDVLYPRWRQVLLGVG